MSFKNDPNTYDLFVAKQVLTRANKAHRIAEHRFMNPSLPRDPDFQEYLGSICLVLVEYLEHQKTTNS